MSTDHQQYSTQNQEAAIREYADAHGYRIVRRYADEGKSGLSLQGRDELNQLIEDVQSGAANFAAVLVYDISRWGRFLDADESAYYEYICRRAGIAVHYCAEQFTNDGSPVSTIVKGVKRAMAGEYSRELSAKVFAGHCRLVELGYRQGGPPGYGLRRMRIDQHGVRQGTMEKGQHKSLQTDRVILVPGPDDEVRTVRRIFDLFVNGRKTATEIAELLNQDDARREWGETWKRSTIHHILTSEKYIGNNIYNRVSRKLKLKRIANPPDMWIRADGAFTAIVDKELFRQAQQIIQERTRKYSNEDLLAHLRQLLDTHGRLSAVIIDDLSNGPSTTAYRSRFGSLLCAYKLIGYTPDRDYRYIEINRFLRSLHPKILDDCLSEIARVGGYAEQTETGLLLVNGEFTASIVIARCTKTSAGSNRWKLRLETGKMPDITIGIRLDSTNSAIKDYYLLPFRVLRFDAIRLADENEITLDAFRFDNLDYLFAMASRLPLSKVA